MRVIVTGANGYIGKAIIDRLVQEGHDVVALVRKESDFVCSTNPKLHYGLIKGDLSEVKQYLQDDDLIIHAAGRAHQKKTDKKSFREAYWTDNVTLPLRLAQLGLQANMRGFLFISSIGAEILEKNINCGKATLESEWEKSPFRASKLHAEQHLRILFEEQKASLTIVRLPMVYGMKAPGYFKILCKILSFGLPLPFYGMKAKRSFISIVNLTDFVAHWVKTERIISSTFAIRDGDEISAADYMRALSKAAGYTRARLFPFPKCLLKLASRMFGRSSFYDSLALPLPVDISVPQKVLGWTPPYKTEEALRLIFAKKKKKKS